MQDTAETLRVAGTVNDSIVDGPGIRFTVFAQGCPHNCAGCHNPETHDPAGGHAERVDDLIARLSKNPLLDGITLSGGEPFAQSAACARLARAAHGRGLSVWTYSGYTYEQLCAMAAADADVRALLADTDVLVDGPFLLAERSLELRFCGSRNQRLIDLKATRAAGEVVCWKPREW